MNPFFFDRIVNSEKNGSLNISGNIFSREIRNGWFYQSGPYVDRMFRFGLKKISKHHPVKHILLLGLGGGGVVREIKKRFKNAHITAIEYDPEMVHLCKTWYLQTKYQTDLEIHTQDAREAIFKLSAKFDLIIVDLFIDSHVSPLLASSEFVYRLHDLLNRGGYLLVNFFNEDSIFASEFAKFFFCAQMIQYRFNSLRLYRHFGQGYTGESLPKEYIDKGQSRQYLRAVAVNGKNSELIDRDNIVGVRTNIGSLYFETYVSDVEPIIKPFPFPRLIVWQPLTITRTKGWFTDSLSDKNNQHGFAILKEKEYWKEWSHHAQRHRTRFLKDDRFTIQKVDIDAFATAYHSTRKLGWLLRTGFIRVLRHHLERHPKDVHLFGVIEKRTEKIVAGLAVIDYPDISQSFHTIAFIHPSVRHTSVGFGLIDHWYQYAREKGIRCLNFGLVWRKGNPRAWKGYSKFKRQFHLHLICYPQSLVKFVWREK